ncbi:MAG: alkaline phosphatase D family protein [Planctomycetota bacterium]
MRFARFRTALGTVLLTLLSIGCVSGQPIAGPVVGEVTAARAQVWMYLPETSECTVTYRLAGESRAGASQGYSASFAFDPSPAVEGTSRPARVTLDGLLANRKYEYEIAIDGKSSPNWVGSFRTPPKPRTPSRLRLALTSCMKFGQPQDSWYLLLAQQPDLHLTLGDTQYSDTTDPKVQWEHHVRYRAVPQFATVIRNVPTLAMWDDHDYGPNNSDGTAKGKEKSLAGWKQFWANPKMGTTDTPGAFFRYTWGDVDFFVVDGRYHRSPDDAPDDEKKKMLGDAQFAWLVDGLKSSKAKFKVIASGSTLDHSTSDGWKIYTHARRRLFDAIRKNSVSGVVYLSGDIHRSLVWEHHESDRVGYPLVEVISSGVANSKTHSFATVDFDTTLADPELRVRIVYGDGTVRTDRRWKLSQLGGR